MMSSDSLDDHERASCESPSERRDRRIEKQFERLADWHHKKSHRQKTFAAWRAAKEMSSSVYDPLAAWYDSDTQDPNQVSNDAQPSPEMYTPRSDILSPTSMPGTADFGRRHTPSFYIGRHSPCEEEIGVNSPTIDMRDRRLTLEEAGECAMETPRTDFGSEEQIDEECLQGTRELARTRTQTPSDKELTPSCSSDARVDPTDTATYSDEVAQAEARIKRDAQLSDCETADDSARNIGDMERTPIMLRELEVVERTDIWKSFRMCGGWLNG